MALWIAGLIVVAPAAAVAVAVAVIDPNDYKPQLIQALQQATGRTLSIGGPIAVRASLWPTIIATRVQLGNLPGGSRADMARAERVEAQLSLPALLWHRLEIIKLTLVGPNILFEQVAGKSNWVFDTGEKASPATYRLRLRDVLVQNGMVTSHLPARTWVVGMRALRVQYMSHAGPLRLDGVLVYGDNQPFGLQARADPAANGQWATKLQLTAFHSTVAASGMATLAGAYDLQVDGHSPALERLNALLPGLNLPAVHEASLTTHLINGPVPGDIPVIGETALRFASADFGGLVPGLTLGATTISLPAAGGMAAVTGGLQLFGQAFTIAGGFGVPQQLNGRAEMALDLTAQSPPGGAAWNAGLKGKLALDRLSFAGLDAEAGLQTADLAPLASAAFGQALPKLTDVRAQARLQVPASGQPLSVTAARLQTHEGDLAGEATIGPGLTVTARLRSSRLDLDALLPAFDPAAKPAGGTVISDAPLPWPELRGPSLDVTATLDAVTWQRQVWPKAEAVLRLKGGVLENGKLVLATPGGPASLSLTANAADTAASLVIAAPAIPLALIAREADLPGAVAGTVQVNANLHATGRSLHDLAASLDGSLAAASHGGQMSNAAVIQLTRASLDALGIKVPAEGETALHCFALNGSFSKGLGQFPLIALQTSYVQVEGVGQVNLGRETLALRLQPMTRVAGSPVAVPVVVEGPFRAIKGRLDANGLEKVGILVDGLLGGDPAGTCKANP